MNEPQRDVDTPEPVAEPASVTEPASVGEPMAAPPRDYKKIMIGVGICIVLWIIAMFVKGMGESTVNDGTDKFGRPSGISVEKQSDAETPKPQEATGERRTKPNLAELEIERDKLDQTVWAKEVEAERYEATLVKLWDDVRSAEKKDRLAVFEAAAPASITLGTLGGAEDLGLGIRNIKIGAPQKTLTADAFRKLLAGFRTGGYVVEQCEWWHADFTAAAAGTPARSTVGMVIQAHGAGERRRVTIRGDLKVEWSDRKDAAGNPIPQSVDASQLSLTVRDAVPAFVDTLKLPVTVPETLAERRLYRRPWPIVLDDLDGDGLPELMLAGRNLIYPNLGGGKFGEPRMISPQMPGIASIGALADFNGDGFRDLLCFGPGLVLTLAGDGKGAFADPIVAAKIPLKMPTALATGDVDGDGDLDVFIGQYKGPWEDGQTPTPYYDANDGEPAYLLRNEGGTFSDITASSGLMAKRNRRSYGASLVDLNDDGKLDLLVTSDFAGVDLYFGDGNGRFTDVTATMLPERHGLSVSHTFADFDTDGKLDFFVASESSHVVRRFDRMGIGRTDRPEETKMRTVMGYGNRMYLARGDKFELSPFAEQLAETGASRGCVSFDADNDGDVDLYITNGRLSGNSAKEIASNYWRHGIYLGSSEPDSALSLMFSRLFQQPVGLGDASRSGFQHNALLLNRGKNGFIDVGFALGTAFERDGLAAIAGDIDNDGRVDLVVMDCQFNSGFPSDAVYTLRNTLETGAHWIGLRLHRSASGRAPIGAKVTLTAGGVQRTAAVVTGESFASQRGPVVHFGLGAATAVDKIDIRWPDGKTETLTRPAVDRYHDVGVRSTEIQ